MKRDCFQLMKCKRRFMKYLGHMCDLRDRTIEFAEYVLQNYKARLHTRVTIHRGKGGGGYCSGIMYRIEWLDQT